MKEIKKGPYRLVPQGSLPGDAQLLEALDSYRVSLSLGEQCLLIETTSYHPGTLCITREELEGILGRFQEAERRGGART